MVSILAGLNGLLPWCTMAHGHAFANCVPELYNQDAKEPSCLAHAQRLTTSCHTGTCAYVAYVCGKRRFEAAQRACSTPASQRIGAAVANGAWSHIRKHLVLARRSACHLGLLCCHLLGSMLGKAIYLASEHRRGAHGYMYGPYMYPCGCMPTCSATSQQTFIRAWAAPAK
jgi:hypothetical protein